MNSARRCSTLLGQMYASSRGGPAGKTPFPPAAAAASAPAGSRSCQAGVGGTCPPPTASGVPGPGTATVCAMGGSASRRTFGTTPQTWSGAAPLTQPAPDPEEDPEQAPAPEPAEGGQDRLLRECEQALRRRPARPHRDLVRPPGAAPHSHGDGPPIRVMQWNILAQALGEGKDEFIRCPQEALNWQERKYLILEEILTYGPDILCLQEVDHYYDTFQPIMAGLGYLGTFLAKPWSPCLDVERNNGPDGCALFVRRSRFSAQPPARLRLSATLLPTNQVAIAQTLTCRRTGRRLCVAVTHLKARGGWERLRGAQGADLLRSLQGLTAPPNGQPANGQPAAAATPLLVCGDFNAEPSEEVYRRFSSSPLGLGSAYKLLSADGQTEPAYTTWKIRPSGENRSTLDYIWYSRRALSVDRLLDIPTEEQIGPDRLPSYHYPSDHLSLLCDFSFREETHRPE